MDELRYHLQTVYCPPLDSSLLAVLVAELETECNAFDTKIPTQQQISDLTRKLDLLSALAEEQSYSEDTFGAIQSDCSPKSISYSSEDTPEWSSGDVTTSTSSGRSYGPFISSVNRSSPMTFLRTVFPDVDTVKLKAAIARSRVGAKEEDIDMGAIVEELLTSEYNLEIQERGLNEDDRSFLWKDAKKTKQGGERRKPSLTVQTSKKVPAQSTKIVITDVRQRQNSPCSPYSPSSMRPPPAPDPWSQLTSPPIPSSTRPPPSPDPWSQLTSLAIYLSTIIPSRQPSYFQSAFHSPLHSTPSNAIRSCLSNIVDSEVNPSSSVSPTTSKTQLFAMFDILRCLPIYFDLDPEQRDRVFSDARLALGATQNNPDRALEIVEALLDLDTGLDLGVYHTAVPTSTAKTSKYTAWLPSSPTLDSPPSASWTKSNTSNLSITSQPDIFPWQTVPQRKITQGQNTLAASIPSYNSCRKTKIKGSGNGIGKGGKGDVGELSHSEKMARLRNDRGEALKEATRYWKRGNSVNRGGEIAGYFADRARGIQTQIRSEELDVAREIVMSKRITSVIGDEVDMHGIKVAEAIVIVKELLLEEPPSNTKPLKIITGRGNHSVRKTGVLKPAITNALAAEGWDVSDYDGWVIVRGKR